MKYECPSCGKDLIVSDNKTITNIRLECEKCGTYSYDFVDGYWQGFEAAVEKMEVKMNCASCVEFATNCLQLKEICIECFPVRDDHGFRTKPNYRGKHVAKLQTYPHIDPGTSISNRPRGTKGPRLTEEQKEAIQNDSRACGEVADDYGITKQAVSYYRRKYNSKNGVSNEPKTDQA